MPSNKLSGRRSTAKRPSVCISVPTPWIFLTTAAHIKIVWINTFEPPPLIGVSQTITAYQDPVDPTLFVWNTPGVVPNTLKHVQLTAPLDTEWNALIFSAYDQYTSLHYSETYFQPPRPPPFSQDFDCHSYDYPDPDVLRAEIRPVPK